MPICSEAFKIESVPINYLIWARLLSMALSRQVQQPRITKGSKMSPFLPKHLSWIFKLF